MGAGANKQVYAAFDEQEGMEVAWNEISVLQSDTSRYSEKEIKRKLHDEVKMLQQLRHKNIIKMMEWWFDRKEQKLVFISELFAGGSLRK